jgi:hypothetical protein
LKLIKENCASNSKVDDDIFESWVSSNFDESNTDVDYDLRVVTIEVERKNIAADSNTSMKRDSCRRQSSYIGYMNVRSHTNEDLAISAKRDELIDKATENMRSFDSRNFSDDLLIKSPREYESNEEKEQLYKISDKVDSSKIKRYKDKIDYFISHSWSDDKYEKCKVMKDFTACFEKKPTFWFDKVCINQISPMDGVAVLPINIGACKKMLIVMGPTYLKRLWCIWEIFTLFCFCNDELAAERIEILPLIDTNELIEQLETFNIDEAHCFDPNEEYKLRYLMLKVIGKEKLKSCIDKVRKILDPPKKAPSMLSQVRDMLFVKPKQVHSYSSVIESENTNLSRSG